MFGRIGKAVALAAGIGLAGTAAGGDNTVRLVDRPEDRTTTRTLELKPADREAALTELTGWGRGGFGHAGWGHVGWGHAGWGHVGWGHAGWGWGGWGHHHGWGWGLSVGYYGGWGWG